MTKLAPIGYDGAGLGVADWTPREEPPANTKASHKAPGGRAGHRRADRRDRRRSAPAGIRSDRGPPLLDAAVSIRSTPPKTDAAAWELEKELVLAQLVLAGSWLSDVFNQAAAFNQASQTIDEVKTVSPSREQVAFAADGVTLTHWPPEWGYCNAFDGWQKSEVSTEWLHKPSNGIFFHMPSETLWKRACGDRLKFVRIDERATGFESVTIAAWGDSVAGRRALLKACLLAWSQQLRKFEDMDRDLANFNEGSPPKPRVSASSTPNRGDQVQNLLRPAATALLNFIESQRAPSAPPTDRSYQPQLSTSQSLADDASSCSDPEEPEPQVSKEILRMRSIARGR